MKELKDKTRINTGIEKEKKRMKKKLSAKKERKKI